MICYCQNCKKQLSKNDIFCPNCGQKNFAQEQTNKLIFLMPIILFVISYVVRIALHIILAINNSNYLEGSEINCYLKPETIVTDFLISYSLLFIVIFLYIYNKKKQSIKLSIANIIFISYLFLLPIIIDFMNIANVSDSYINFFWRVGYLTPGGLLISPIFYSFYYKFFNLETALNIIVSLFRYVALILTLINIKRSFPKNNCNIS